MYLKSIALVLLGVFFASFASAVWENTDDTVNISVDILEPSILIEVDTNYLHLGQVTEGYKTHGFPISVTNKGTAKAIVKTQIQESADALFLDYLLFGSSTCTTTCKKANEYNFTLDGESGNYIGEGSYDSETFYAKLDLTSYSGSDLTKRENLTAQITFLVMPA